MEANTMNPDQTAPTELSDWGQYCLQYRPLKYCKISIQAHALIEAHFPVWTPKCRFFKQISPKMEPLIKAHPRILKNYRSNLMQKHHKFVISSKSNLPSK